MAADGSTKDEEGSAVGPDAGAGMDANGLLFSSFAP